MRSKQEYLPETLSKFNSTLHSDSFIECQINHSIRKKKLQAVFALPPQPNGALHNYSIVHSGYRRTYCHSICADVFFVNTEFYALRKPTIMAMTVERIDKRTDVSLIHMVIVATIY